MSDSELRDQAVAHLRQTTAGYLKSSGAERPPPWPEGSAHWQPALSLLAQIGQTPPPPPPPPPSTEKLTWRPPGFPDYVGFERRVIDQAHTKHTGSGGDVVFDWREVITDAGGDRRVVISGFRHAVIIGGECHRTATTVLNNSVCVQVDRCTGIVHLEGLKLYGSGVSDCIVFTAGPEQGGQAGVVCRIQNVYGEPNSIQGNHGDGVQIWGDPGGGWNGGFKQLDIDRFTVHSSYQGIFLGTHDGAMRGGDFRRVNLKGVPGRAGATRSGMGWIFAKTRYPDVGGFTSTVTLDDVWAENSVGAWGSYAHMVTPNDVGDDALGNRNPARKAVMGSDAVGQFVHWPDPASDVKGKLRVGDPPGGDFVPASRVGLGYVSPGYV